MVEGRWRKKAMPAKLGRRRRRLFFVKLASLGIFFVALLTGVVFLFRAQGIQVQHIAVIGAQSTSKDELIALAQKVGQGSYLFVFPKTNIALYPRETLAAGLLSQFPQLKSAEVDTDGLSTLTISVAERSPVGVWCETDDEESCYFLDETGYIYGKAPSFSAPVYMRYLGRDSENVGVKTFFLPQESFKELQAFLAAVKKVGLTPRTFAIVDAYDFRLDMAEGPYFLIARKDTFTEVLANMEAVMGAEAVRGKLSKLLYVDLRFGNKVYYKEK